MFPNVRSSKLTVQGANSTSWAIDFPLVGDIKDGGSDIVVAGDIILVAIGRDGTGTTRSISGYTEKFFNAASGANSLIVFAKVAVGDETTIPNFATTTEQGVVRVIIIKDTNAGSLADIEVGGAASSGGSASPDPLSFSPSWALTDTRWTAICSNDGGAVTVTGYPSGFDDNPNADASGGGTGAGLGSASKNERIATMDAGAFTLSASEQWAAAVVAIRGNDVVPPSVIVETATATDTISANVTTSASIVETAAASDNPNYVSAYPLVLGTSKGTTAAGTSHTVTLPTGIQVGEAIAIFCAADGATNFNNLNGWANSTGTSTVGYGTYSRIADGTEGSSVSIPTAISAKISYVAVRVSAGARIVQLTRQSNTGTASPAHSSTTSGNFGLGRLVLSSICYSGNTVTVTSPHGGFSLVDSQLGGASDEGSVYLESMQRLYSAYETHAPTSATLSASTNSYFSSVSFAFIDSGLELSPINAHTSPSKNGYDLFYQNYGIDDNDFGYGQSFIGNGEAIKAVVGWLRKNDASQTAGTIVAKIYAITGTFGTDSTPTGSALATSDAININDLIGNTSNNFNQAIKFTFATPFTPTLSTNYVVTFEVSGNGTTHTVRVYVGSRGEGNGNPCHYIAGAWDGTPVNSSDTSLFFLSEVAVPVSVIVETTPATDSASATNSTSASVAETATATEIQSSTIATSSDVVESVSSIDTQSATRTTSAVVVESTSASETQDGIKVALVSLSETATSTDTQSATRATSSDVVESVTSTDTQSATRATSSDVAESTSASETQDGLKVTLVSVDETAVAAETQGASKSSLESVVESVTSTDTQSATRATSSAVAESTSASETQDGVKVTLVSIVEAATATEAQGASKSSGASVIESATATDDPQATLLSLLSVVESTSAADTQSAEKTTGASVSETVTATDVTNAIKLVVASVTELVTASDTQGATRATLSDVVELASSSETQEGSVGNNVSAIESANATDTQSVTVVGLVNAVEAAVASDSQSATRATSASMTESAAAVHAEDALRTLALSVAESVTSTASQGATNFTYAIVQGVASASDSQDAEVYSSIVVSATVAGLLGVVSATSAYGSQSYRKKSVIRLDYNRTGRLTLTLKKISK